MKTNVNNISFNVSKTINIGNFEAIKINYGESVTIDPTKPLEIQREKMIESCYAVVKKEAEIWTGLHKIQHIDNQKNTKVYKAKSK
jgi:carbamoylphosphate synthase large subunit